MVLRFSLLLLILQVALLGTLAGCQTSSRQTQSAAGSYADEDSPTLAPGHPRASGTGMLLQTGAIQLGSDVGRNQWRWQGDGKGGF